MADEQLNIFSSFYEAGPQNWGSRPKPPATDLAAPQLPIATTEGLVPHGEVSGALARQVTPHSLTKQHRVFRYADTVSTAMKNRFKVWWIDLFAGPGTVYERHSSRFHDAVPLQVVNGVRRPLDGYVFNDISRECVTSLRTLLGERPVIDEGDANDTEYLEQLLSPVPRDALVIAYLDPEGLHLHLETVRFLAWRFRMLDLLINVPVLNIDRAISAGGKALERSKPVLEHPDPRSLIAGRQTGPNIRAWFKAKLKEMGFPPELVTGHEIRSEGNQTPQYDLMLASRNKKAPELYHRANQIEADGQRGLGLAI